MLLYIDKRRSGLLVIMKLASFSNCTVNKALFVFCILILIFYFMCLFISLIKLGLLFLIYFKMYQCQYFLKHTIILPSQIHKVCLLIVIYSLPKPRQNCPLLQLAIRHAIHSRDTNDHNNLNIYSIYTLILNSLGEETSSSEVKLFYKESNLEAN